MTLSLFLFSEIAVVERRSGTSKLGSVSDLMVVVRSEGELMVTSVPLRNLSMCFINELSPVHMSYKCLAF
jgi:hypothetical protein